MASAPMRDRPRLPVHVFRRFVEGRPEEERWELIDGVAVMMAPPTLAHQIIAGNLQHLLNDALEIRVPTLVACQRAGVNIGPLIEHYDPEPDVIVIDTEAAETPGERYADRFYLAAEIVSSSERTYIESKREIYKLHDACKYILTIHQDRVDIRIDRRAEAGWNEELLRGLGDPFVLADFGLRCKVWDIYRGTSLAPRQAARH
jgi:Uma2 family endonuclease